MNIIFLSSTEADIAIEQMLRILGAPSVSPVDSGLPEACTTLFPEGATPPEFKPGDRVIVTPDGTDKRLWPQFRDADTFKGTVISVSDWDEGRGLRVKVDGAESPCEDCEGFLFYADQCEPIADEPAAKPEPEFKEGDHATMVICGQVEHVVIQNVYDDGSVRAVADDGIVFIVDGRFLTPALAPKADKPEPVAPAQPRPNTPEERAQLMLAEAAGKKINLAWLNGLTGYIEPKAENVWLFGCFRYEIDGEAFVEPPLKTGDRVIVTVEEVDVLGPAGTELAGTFLEYEDEDGNFCVRLAGVGDDWFRPHQVRRAEALNENAINRNGPFRAARYTFAGYVDD